MSTLAVSVIFQDIKVVESDAIVVGFFEDMRPLKNLAGQLDWLLCGALSRLIIERRMRGTLGEVALLTNRDKIPAGKIFLVGLGPRLEFNCAALKRVASRTAASVVNAGAQVAALEYFPPVNANYEEGIHALQDGLKEGAGERRLSVSLVTLDKTAYDRISQQLCIDLHPS
jgi:cytosol aminopeptidase family protein